jgi:hypothetical protein
MQAQYNISNVFLATQDARILLAAKAQPGLRVIAMPFDRDQLTGNRYLQVGTLLRVGLYLMLLIPIGILKTRLVHLLRT